MKKNYFKIFTLGILTMFSLIAFGQPNAWINEIHYDNDGGDLNESVEVVVENPGSWDLSLLQVDKYNGNGGVVYGTDLVSTFTIGATSGDFTVYSIIYPANGLQNGAPDGLALSYNGTLIQFLSYEGTILATDGPANGETSVDIGVSEVGTTPVGESLQLIGTGAGYADFSWNTPATATLGLVNTSQIITGDVYAPASTWVPADGETAVPINSTITITYDEAIRNLDDSEITDANVDALISLRETDAVGTIVTFDATIDAGKQVITITPSADLSEAQVYYVAMGPVEDALDNASSLDEITFTSYDPAAPVIAITAPVGGEVFYAGDSPTVTWTSDNVTNVDIVVYDPVLDQWSIIANDIASDGTEVIDIPADAIYSNQYRIAVVDYLSTIVADTSDAFTVISTPSISDIQSDNTAGASNYESEIVRTSGTVSYINGNNYYLKDGTGAWSGIAVYDVTNAGSLTVGDSITLVGTVGEYFEVTQLSTITSLVTNTTGKAISSSLIATGDYDESFESVIVKIIDAQVTNPDIGNGEFEINDGSGVLVVDDQYYPHPAVQNENITITAMGYFSYGAYKILPRTLMDIVSSSDTVTSSEYTIDNTANTITGMAFSTTLATFEANISACDSSTHDVYDADGITPATVLDDTKLIIVTAADGITSRTYTITRNAVITNANVSSATYTVDNTLETIIDIPFGTDLATFESNIVTPEYGAFETYESDSSTVATDLQTGYVLIGTAEDGVSLKYYTITVNSAPLDSDSYVSAPTTQVPAATVVIADNDSEAEAFEVISFDIVDEGTVDGEPTEISQIVLFYGPNNTASFETDIDSGYFEFNGVAVDLAGDPVFGMDSVAFPIAAGQMLVADGGSATVLIKLILQEHATEGNVIQFMVDANQHGFMAHTAGSGFLSDFTTDIVGNDITIDVVATELQFTSEPTNVETGENISPAVVVEATDEFGNTDSDFASDISITATGSSMLFPTHTATPILGIATFDTLEFIGPAAAVVNLTATASSLTSAISSNFIVSEPVIPDLFFSEYIEGSSNNKALEIMNPTDSEVNLDGYVMRGSSNVSTEWEYLYTFPAGATIASGDVYVIVDDAAVGEMQDVADWSTSGYEVGFNGNDARGLFKIVGSDTIIIDILGTEVNPDESFYSVAGIASGMVDVTLLRKSSVTTGNIDWTASAGTNTDDSEWVVYDIDYFSNLGSPTAGMSSETEILEFTFPGLTVSSEIFPEKDSIACELIYSAQLDSLFPVFSLSRGASSEPASTDSMDFSAFADTILVTAEDGVTQAEWEITVTKAAAPLTDNDIVDIEFADEIGDPVINATNHVVDVYLQYGVEIDSLLPIITVSTGATSNPATGDTVDFTADSVSVIVTAESGVSQEWKIVTHQTAVDVSTIAELRAGAQDGTVYMLTGEAVITFQQSYRGKKYIQDATGAIEIDDPSGNISTTYNQYDGVTGIAGSISEYGGLMQLTPVIDPGAASSTGNTVTPLEVTISALEADWEAYEAELIQIVNLSMVDGGDNFANGQNYDAFDGNEDTITVRVHFYDTDLTGTQIPDSSNVTGIALESFGSMQIAPRRLADVEELIALSSNADLNAIRVNTVAIDGFSAAQLNYTVTLPAATTVVPDVTYELADQDASAIVADASSLPGTTTITVTAPDGTQKIYSVYFELETSSINGISMNAIRFYPSPVNTELTIVNTQNAETIQIVDVTGKLVYEQDVNGSERLVVNVEPWNSGMYILRAIAKEQILIRRLIKE